MFSMSPHGTEAGACDPAREWRYRGRQRWPGTPTASGFYYTRYPRAGERPPADLTFYQQVYFHRLGTDTKQDTYSLGKEFPRIAEIQLRSSDDGRYVLATHGQRRWRRVRALSAWPGGSWHQFARLSDEIAEARFGPDGNLYLLSRLNAPRGKLLKAPVQHPNVAEAQTVVPESKVAIESFLPAGKRCTSRIKWAGPRKSAFSMPAGTAQGTVPLLAVSARESDGARHGRRVAVRKHQFSRSARWYRFDPSSRKPRATAMYRNAVRPTSATPK